MNTKFQNTKEKKQFIPSSVPKPYTPKGIMNNKQPEFFSYFLNTLLKIYNFLIFIYIIMSLVVFFMFQVYERNITKKEKDQKITLDTNTTNLNKFFVGENSENAKGELSILQNDQIMSITFIAVYLSILIVLNNFSMSKKSPTFFSLFFLLSISISINFLSNLLENIPFLKPFSDPFKKSNELFSLTFLIFQYIFCAMNSLILTYFIYIYFAQIGYFKYNLESLSFEKIYEEIALRTDMMKISFNYWIISMKLNKLFPGLMYRKKDYFFNKMEINSNADEIREIEDELNDKVCSLEKSGNNEKNFSNCRKSFSNSNYSSDAIHSKSTIDCEYESFK